MLQADCLVMTSWISEKWKKWNEKQNGSVNHGTYENMSTKLRCTKTTTSYVKQRDINNQIMWVDGCVLASIQSSVGKLFKTVKKIIWNT